MRQPLFDLIQQTHMQATSVSLCSEVLQDSKEKQFCCVPVVAS